MAKKIVSFFILFSMIICITVFAFMLYESFIFWRATYTSAIGVPAKMFWASLLMAIVAGGMYFIEFFIKTIGESVKQIRYG